MILCLLDHNIEHFKADLEEPEFLMNWLAFNPVEDKLMVEIEAEDSQGLEVFKTYYKGSYEAVDTHALPFNPEDWVLLGGVVSPDLDHSSPLKLIDHLTTSR